MKRLIFSLAVLCLVFSLTACSAKNGEVSQLDLLHRNYVLISIDGEPFSIQDHQPNIEFGAGFRVSGAVCNRYTGQGVLKNSVLTVDQMASTKMLCIDPALNQLESDFSNMLMNGVRVSQTANSLTLSHDGRVLLFRIRDWVQ